MEERPYRIRIFYCPTHGRIEVSYYLNKPNTIDPCIHPGCDCERWFTYTTIKKAKRTGES